MAFPTGWPPRPASSLRSIRFFVRGTSTAVFDGHAYLFGDQASANTFKPTPYVRPGSTDPVHDGTLEAGGSPMGGRQIPEDAAPRTHDDSPNTQEASPHPMLWSQGIRITSVSGGDIEFSFDGTNVHGRVKDGTTEIYYDRHEAGIAVRAAGGVGTPVFEVEAW